MNFANYRFLGQCNGIDCQGADITGRRKEQIESIFDAVLHQFETMLNDTPGTKDGVNARFGYMVGSRCTLSGVLSRLQGKGYQIEQTLASSTAHATLRDWVLDALRDCASADYYYNFEKDYGND